MTKAHVCCGIALLSLSLSLSLSLYAALPQWIAMTHAAVYYFKRGERSASQCNEGALLGSGTNEGAWVLLHGVSLSLSLSLYF